MCAISALKIQVKLSFRLRYYISWYYCIVELSFQLFIISYVARSATWTQATLTARVPHRPACVRKSLSVEFKHCAFPNLRQHEYTSAVSPLCDLQFLGRVAEALDIILYGAINCPEHGPRHQIIKFSSRQACKSISSISSLSQGHSVITYSYFPK